VAGDHTKGGSWRAAWQGWKPPTPVDARAGGLSSAGANRGRCIIASEPLLPGIEPAFPKQFNPRQLRGDRTALPGWWLLLEP
jgi:hypothetical protein